MDPASILGLIVLAGSIAYAASSGGGGVGSFFDLPSLVCVVGGCVAALFLSYPLRAILGLRHALRRALTHRSPNFEELGEVLLSLAETARREGLLALDAKLSELEDPFLALGVQLAVDGTRPDEMEDVLRAEIDSTAAELAVHKGLFDQLGKYAPAFGMIGTLVGLVMMLGRMSDPSAIGPGMAVALLTTLYGALFANAVCLPCAERLNYLNKQELAAREMIVRGILAIQSGDSPRIVQRKLSMYLKPIPQQKLARAA
jgi:chemotaxis protein MotA